MAELNQEENNLRIFKKISGFEIFSDPFPHLVVKEAFPKSTAKILTNNFPISQFSKNRDGNLRQDLSSFEVQSIVGLEPLWKQLINYYSSPDFFFQVMEIFESYINGEIKELLINLSEDQIGRRNFKDLNKKVLLDAQISVNTPVINPGSVRKCHLDSPNKIYSGLIYFRQPYDDSDGGHLQICKWKDSINETEKIKLYKEGLSEKYFEVSKQINYENNVLILFLNSINSLHLVTPRSQTNHHRTFVNLVAEAPFNIYERGSFLYNNKNNLIKHLKKLAKLFIPKKY